MAFRRGQTVFKPSRLEQGVRITHETSDGIPGWMKVKPILDRIVVQPLEGARSHIIRVVSDLEPIRGVVLAIGPGIHPWKYDHREKHKRTKAWRSRHFRPSEVLPGDIVHLGAFMFQDVQWGDCKVVIAREEDVCGIEPPELDMSAPRVGLETDTAPEDAEWVIAPAGDDTSRWQAYRKVYWIVADEYRWFSMRGNFASADEAIAAVRRYVEARAPRYLNAKAEPVKALQYIEPIPPIHGRFA